MGYRGRRGRTEHTEHCLHLVHRPGHINLKQGWGKPLLLNNFEATNTNAHSNHLATLNSGKVAGSSILSNLNLTVINPVLTCGSFGWQQ